MGPTRGAVAGSLAAIITVAIIASCHTPQRTGQAAPAPLQTQAPAAPGPSSLIDPDSAADRARMVKEVLATIPGRDTLPAGQVFKHVTTGLRAVSAKKFLAIMDIGYGRSLGVSCAHCHVTTAWESEEKPQKQIAREMARMDSAVIFGYLANIKHLRSEQPLVNCTTCHRGSVKPALDLR